MFVFSVSLFVRYEMIFWNLYSFFLDVLVVSLEGMVEVESDCTMSRSCC